MEDLNKVTVVEGPGGLTGWSTPNSSTSVTNDAVKVTFTTTNTGAVSMSKTFSTTASKHYRLSFNADAATYTNVSVEIVGYGGNALSRAIKATEQYGIPEEMFDEFIKNIDIKSFKIIAQPSSTAPAAAAAAPQAKN